MLLRGNLRTEDGLPFRTCSQKYRFPKGGYELRLAQTTVLFALASIVGMISTFVMVYVLDIREPNVFSLCSHRSMLCGCI